MPELSFPPSPSELREIVRLQNGGRAPADYGWGTRMRLRFGYFTPDEVYEAAVSRLIEPGCSWLDVGCGRHLFPSNGPLARVLADRAGSLVGVDPDATIGENPFVHERIRGTIESFPVGRRFDVVTLRMVAEHITDPRAAAAALARLAGVGGRVVIDTINRWSPVSIASRLTPFALHHPIKRLFWGGEEKDTFPVAYRMNTRRALRRLLEPLGFREEGFAYLDDCRVTSAFRRLQCIELSAWRALRAIGRRYPENNLLGIYRRVEPSGSSCAGSTAVGAVDEGREVPGRV